MTEKTWVARQQWQIFAGYSVLVTKLPALAAESGIPTAAVAILLHDFIVTRIRLHAEELGK